MNGATPPEDLVEAVLSLTDHVMSRLDSAPRIREGLFPWRRDDEGDFRLVVDEPDDSLLVFKVLNDLEVSPQVIAATTAIEADDVIGPHIGHLVGDP